MGHAVSQSVLGILLIRSPKAQGSSAAVYVFTVLPFFFCFCVCVW